MVTQLEVSLLVRFIVAHVLSDFVFQRDSWVEQRFQKGWFSKQHYVHGIAAGILAYIFSGLWGLLWIPAVVAITHILIDRAKAGCEDDTWSFLADQLAHFTVLVAVWLVIITPSSEDIAALGQIFLEGTKIWVIIAAYVIIIWPSSVLISKMTEKWRMDLFENESSGYKDRSLENAGRWIGRLERFLILTFVLLQQYAAIGLLVTAKSVFRFTESRKVGEYILIGTLMSFVIGITVGLMASLVL